jgi:hypothetical protein
MKKRNDNPQDLIVKPNEQITISIVQSTGLLEEVNYSLDGSKTFPGTKPKNQPCTFPVSKNGDLAMTMHYAGNSGGNFKVKVTGSAGGDSEVSGTQPDKATFESIGFRFRVEAN